MSSSNFQHLVRVNCSSMENTRPTSTWVWTDSEVDIALLPLLMYLTGRSKLWGQDRGLGRRGLTAGFLDKSGLRNGYSLLHPAVTAFTCPTARKEPHGAAVRSHTHMHTQAHTGPGMPLLQSVLGISVCSPREDHTPLVTFCTDSIARRMF